LTLLACREQVAESEEAIFGDGVEHGAAMRAVAEGPPGRSPE